MILFDKRILSRLKNSNFHSSLMYMYGRTRQCGKNVHRFFLSYLSNRVLVTYRKHIFE